MEKKTFQLGLCLAGAVSAGAYTAGVMDYLFEALAAWERRKQEHISDTPSYQVVIPVIGGASAGAMTAIVTAAAVHNKIYPVRFPVSLQDMSAEQPQNKFYHTWVDLLGEDMFAKMLSTADIEKTKEITSLVNADFIDEMADKVVKVDTANQIPFPAYIHNSLKLFATLTNLEGFPYEISYVGNTSLNKYYMALHNDYARFQFNKGHTNVDGWMPLNFNTGENVETARQAAMASGAFPIGLRSRTLRRNAADVNEMEWLENVNPVDGPFYDTQNIDGGTINNEPFERVRDVLIDITNQDDSKVYNDPDLFESTILLIDPFPSEKPEKFKINTGLFKTIGYTISCLVGQSRAKPGIISSSINKRLAGQFLIAPSRRRPKLNGEEEAVQGEKAIACGAFDGFSGFMHKEFRVHDFFLGRYNCEIMLRDYLVIPESAIANNKIFSDGYAGIDKTKFCMVKKEMAVVDGKDVLVENNYYPIIPVFSSRTKDFPLPIFSSGTNWPVIEEREVEKFRPLLKKRAQAILMHILKLNWVKRSLLWVGAKVLLNKMLTDGAMNMIKGALQDHELLKK